MQTSKRIVIVRYIPQTMPVSKLCRICLQEDKGRLGMQPLFDEKNARCAEIVQRIEECGGIAVMRLHIKPKMKIICLIFFFL